MAASSPSTSRSTACTTTSAAGDRFFWFTTTGWMMWNYLVSGLLVGATIVLFDGDPGHPSLDVLWDLSADVGITGFGTSASFIMSCRKAACDRHAACCGSSARPARRCRPTGSAG